MTKSSTHYARITREYEKWSQMVRADFKCVYQEPTHESIRKAHFVEGLSFATIANRHRRVGVATNYLLPRAIERICNG
ncbi:MAG: hypothetical protein ACUZ8I_10345 [Candidatus Scalindua sp.]